MEVVILTRIKLVHVKILNNRKSRFQGNKEIVMIEEESVFMIYYLFISPVCLHENCLILFLVEVLWLNGG